MYTVNDSADRAGSGALDVLLCTALICTARLGLRLRSALPSIAFPIYSRGTSPPRALSLAPPNSPRIEGEDMITAVSLLFVALRDYVNRRAFWMIDLLCGRLCEAKPE
jgi:hypothetical protein